MENMHLAFVLLSEPHLPDGDVVARRFERFAPAPSERLRVVEPAGESGGVSVLRLDLESSGSAFVALMPHAVPGGEADDAARFSISEISGWTLPPHGAHLVVTLQETQPVPATVSLARFTGIMAAVTEACNAVGLYWGAAGATHNPQFVISVAEEKHTDALLMLWTGVSVAREDDGRLSLLSLGMRQLDLPDLLLTAPAAETESAFECFFDLLAYATNRGAAPADGDTIGRTQDERWTVRSVASPLDPAVEVWRVDMT